MAGLLPPKTNNQRLGYGGPPRDFKRLRRNLTPDTGIKQKMRTRLSNRFAFAFLPGQYRAVADPTPLAADLANGEGIPVQACAHVVEREVDDLGQAGLGQLQRELKQGRQFHKG